MDRNKLFIMGENFQQGYALKRKAIALAEKAGLKFAISQSCCDMGYYCNVDARYDSARYYFRKGLEAGEDLSEAGEACRTMLTNYASSFLFEGKTDSAPGRFIVGNFVTQGIYRTHLSPMW